MLEIVFILIFICCLGTCWAIFHVKKNKKKDKKEKVKKSKNKKVQEEKVDEPVQTEIIEPTKITEDIQLTKNSKLKIVKSATLQARVERVFEKKEEPQEESQEKPVVVIRNSEVKPKKVVGGNAAKKIEQVFTGKKEDEQPVEETSEQVASDNKEPIRTPSIADRIEFREHLKEIYGGFGTGAGAIQNKASEIEKLQDEESDEEPSSGFTDVNSSSIFASLFSRPEQQQSAKKKINLSAKDIVLAGVIMNRPRLSKNLKNFNKK